MSDSDISVENVVEEDEEEVVLDDGEESGDDEMDIEDNTKKSAQERLLIDQVTYLFVCSQLSLS